MSNLHALLADPEAGRVYAADMERDRVLVLDEKTRTRTAIEVDKAPNALAFDTELHRLFVVCSAAGVVDVVDTSNGKVIARLATDAHPYAIAIDRKRHSVFVTNTFSNKITEIDGRTLTAQQRSIGSKDFLLVDEQRSKVYMLGYEDPSIDVLDETSGSITQIPAIAHLWSLALDVSTGELSGVSIAQDALITVKSREGRISASTPTQHMPAAVVRDLNTGKVYVANYASDSVSVFTKTRATTVNVGSSPMAEVIDDSRHRLYVLSQKSTSVTILNTETDSIVAVVRVQPGPFALAVDSNSGRVFTEHYSGDVLEEVAYSSQTR